METRSANKNLGWQLDHHYPCQSKIFLRYVDDTFDICVHGKDRLNEFLENPNKTEESIKLAMEIEMENQMPFLNVLAQKQENEAMKTVWWMIYTYTSSEQLEKKKFIFTP